MDARSVGETVDFNLVLPLRALLEERSVSKAADRLGVSQPTMSGQLKKLRYHFGDQLLVRTGNRHDLTPLAERLLDSSQLTLTSLQRLFSAQSEFDPPRSDRIFTVYASDFSASVIGSVLSRLIRLESPGIGVRFTSVNVRLHLEGPDALRSVDGAIIPYGVLTGGHRLDLISDEWVVVAWAHNPEIGEELRLDALSELPWVQSYGGRTSYHPGLRQLNALGITPRVEVEMPSFLAIPSFIVGTPRIALMQASLAAQFSQGFELRLWPLPVELSPLREGFWWHPSFEHEPDHVWLRTMLDRTRVVLESRDTGAIGIRDTSGVL